MDVGLDVTAMISGTTGVARYAGELLARLPRHPDVEVHPFAIGRAIAPLPAGVRHIRVPLRVVHGAWRHLSGPGARTLAGPVDLVHAPDMVPPPGRTPTVVTIQDVLPLQLPEQYGARYRRIAADQGTGRAARRRGGHQLRGHGGRDRRRPRHPPRHDHRGADRAAQAGRRTGATRRWRAPTSSGVGSLTPRKGLHLLAEAVGRLPPGSPPLLLAGPDGWDAASVHAHLARLDLGSRVRLLGAVSDRQLDGLYRGALLLGHPSVAEGFGMPCVEAMRFGLPVVAADIPPVREICGGAAAALVPPGDVDALAGAIARLLADPDARAVATAAGLERAKAFDWDVMTDRIVARYRSLLAAA